MCKSSFYVWASLKLNQISAPLIYFNDFSQTNDKYNYILTTCEQVLVAYKWVHLKNSSYSDGPIM